MAARAAARIEAGNFEPFGMNVYSSRSYFSGTADEDSQAVQLPREFRFTHDEVLIRRFGRGVLPLPREIFYEHLMAAVGRFKGRFECRVRQRSKA